VKQTDGIIDWHARSLDSGRTVRPGPSRLRIGRWAAADSRSLDQLDERALVEACLAQRHGAFDLIVSNGPSPPPVYQLCYRFVVNHEDASDLSQDVVPGAPIAGPAQAFRGQVDAGGRGSIRIGVNVCLNRVSAKTTLGKLNRADRGEAVRRRGARSCRRI